MTITNREENNMKNDLEEKIIGNALSYQETLSKILGPLNEISPLAKSIEEQQRISRAIIGPVEEIQRQLKPVQNMANQLKPVLNGLSDACREASMSARNLSLPKITVSYQEKEDKIPMPVNRSLYLAKESERQISELKEEIISLKAEIKTEREERKMNGFIEYPEMFMEHPELVKEFLEQFISEKNQKKKKNRTGFNEKKTQRERNKIQCYKLYDELMEKAPNMKVSEIKKVIADKMHTTAKTIGEYLRERP